jgi:uncharacterized protein YjiS (DUF1127 family)
LLQRNIIAFQAPAHPYFSGEWLVRRCAEQEARGTAMFASIVRFVRDWKRYNRSIIELSRLGDRELADIGISRSDIPRVAWKAAHQK